MMPDRVAKRGISALDEEFPDAASQDMILASKQAIPGYELRAAECFDAAWLNSSQQPDFSPQSTESIASYCTYEP